MMRWIRGACQVVAVAEAEGIATGVADSSSAAATARRGRARKVVGVDTGGPPGARANVAAARTARQRQFGQTQPAARPWTGRRRRLREAWRLPAAQHDRP